MAVAPAQPPAGVPDVVVDPDPAQDLYLRQRLQPGRGVGAPGCGEDPLPVPAEGLGQSGDPGLPVRDPADLNLATVALVPLRLDQRQQPVWGRLGELFECGPQALAHQFQPAAYAHPRARGWRRCAVGRRPSAVRPSRADAASPAAAGLPRRPRPAGPGTRTAPSGRTRDRPGPGPRRTSSRSWCGPRSRPRGPTGSPRTAAPTPAPTARVTTPDDRLRIQVGELPVLERHIQPVPYQHRRRALRARRPRRHHRSPGNALETPDPQGHLRPSPRNHPAPLQRTAERTTCQHPTQDRQ